MQEYEAKIAALERLVGRQVLEIEVVKGASKHAPGRKARLPPSSPAPWRCRQQGCELMGLTRSTFYDPSPAMLPADGLLARIGKICDEFE